MPGNDATKQLFVVEQYDDTGTPGRQQALPASPPDLPLVLAVRVPADDVVIALLEGTDEHAVSAAMTAAGWRVDRITAAMWARPDEERIR